MIISVKYKITHDDLGIFKNRLYIDIKYKINNKGKTYKINENLYSFLQFMKIADKEYSYGILSEYEISKLSKYIKENGMEKILRYFIELDLLNRKSIDKEKEDIEFICSQKSNWIDMNF